MADGALEQLLRRDRWITAAAMALLVVLAWIYLLRSGQAGAPSLTAELFPQSRALHAAGMEGMTSAAAWTLRDGLLAGAMWWTMMVAMMMPAAAPTILLYGRVRRSAATKGQIHGLGSTGAFAATYLLVWLGFSIVAVLVQWRLGKVGLLSPETMGSASRWLSAVLLLSAGAYQLSPLKRACLAKCRSPAVFLTRNWRGGRFASVRLGILHGAYCVGCCGILMALLFVGGVMNLVWIAALTTLVLVEKLSPWGAPIGRASGVALCIWGVATGIL